MPKFQKPRGTHDIKPEDQPYWDKIRAAVDTVAAYYHFGRLDTPVLEDTDLFSKGIGKGTDIVEKEMYSFSTKGGDKLTMRPEFTAAVVRSYIEHGLHKTPQPVQVFSIGPLFRHEKPQKNRYRQFHQFDFESIGSGRAVVDAHMIHLAMILLKELKIKDVTVHINNIGSKESRKEYLVVLRNYLKAHTRKIPSDVRTAIKHNPLRIFDAKDEKSKRIASKAPQIIDYIEDADKKKFQTVLDILDCIDVPYIMDPTLVRGLDYYSRTVFEIMPNNTGSEESQATLIGGGRYDYLAKMLGARKQIPAIGFAAGMERLINYMKEHEIKVPEPENPHLFIAHLGDMGRKKALEVLEILRAHDIDAHHALARSSLNAQIKQAKKKGIRLIMILAQKEVLDGNIIFRDIKEGTQDIVDIAKLVPESRKRINRIKKQLEQRKKVSVKKGKNAKKKTAEKQPKKLTKKPTTKKKK